MKTEQHAKQTHSTEHLLGDLKYRLLKTTRSKTPEYYISVRLHHEQEIAYVGTDRDFALSLYNSLISGQVTPCTLRDVVEDAAFETVRADTISADMAESEPLCVNLSK